MHLINVPAVVWPVAPTGEQNEPAWTVPDDGGEVLRVGAGRGGAGVVGRGGGTVVLGAGRGAGGWTVVRGAGFGTRVVRAAVGRLVAVGDAAAEVVGTGAAVVGVLVGAVVAAVVAAAEVAPASTTVRIAAGSGSPPPVAAPITPSVTNAPRPVKTLCRRNQDFRLGAGGPVRCHGGWFGLPGWLESNGPYMVSPRACASETHGTQRCDGDPLDRGVTTGRCRGGGT